MAIRLNKKLIDRVIRPNGPYKASAYAVVIPLKAILASNGDTAVDMLKAGSTYDLVADTDINPHRCIIGVHYNPSLWRDADAPAFIQLTPLDNCTLGIKVKCKRNISLASLTYLCYLTLEDYGGPSWGEDTAEEITNG